MSGECDHTGTFEELNFSETCESIEQCPELNFTEVVSFTGEPEFSWKSESNSGSWFLDLALFNGDIDWSADTDKSRDDSDWICTWSVDEQLCPRVDESDCWDGDTKGTLDFTRDNVELYGFRCAP